MNKIRKAADLVNRLGCPVRLKPKGYPLETWTKRIGLPATNYIELHGPWAFREVEWLEINPIVIEHIGRLVAPKQWNHLEQINALLEAAHLNYRLVDGMVRIPFDAISN